MALVVSNRIQETTSTTGTGTYTLAGAKAGFQSFAAVGNGNTTYYACTDGTDFEVGVGTYTASGTTLARTTIIESSNSNNAVSWTAGDKDIFVTLPASKAVFEDETGDIELAADINSVSNIYLADKLYHQGDADTFISFESNTVGISAVNTQRFVVSDSAVSVLNTNFDLSVGTADIILGDSQNIYLGDANDLQIYHHSTSGSQLVAAEDLKIFTTKDDGQILFYADNGSGGVTTYVDIEGSTGEVHLNHYGTEKIATKSAGVEVTGNIVVSGTVDGRDISTDGNKLDGIAASATANPSALDNIVEDTSPQLGGNLDVQAQEITTSTSNGNIKLTPDGSGVVEVKGAGGNDGTLQLNCSANSHGVKIKSPAHSAGASYTLTLPDNDGNSSEFLQTDGSGNLTWASGSSYTHPNHSGEVTSTGDGATVIADDVVDEANLKVSNTPTDGYILTARSGNTGGLTWEAASSGGSGIALTDLSVTQNSGSGSGALSYNNSSGVFSYTPPATSSGTGVTVHANQAAMLTDAASAAEGSLHYDTDANKLYVKQSSGFFLLATVTNTTPTITSFSEATGGASANNLTTGGTFELTAGSNTVITINATDPDLETLVYSATVTSGTASDVISSPSLPISNQSGNTFTLVPATSEGGSITVRFDVSDGNNIANVTHSFEIGFTVTDSNFTRLLMTTDDAAGGNQSITDSSSTGHTITVSGDAHAGSFSPHRAGKYVSHYNTGTAYVASSSDYDMGSAFTIECWVKADTAGQGNALLAGRENHYWFSSGWSALGSATGKFGFGGYFGSWAGVAASANYVAGQWYFLRGTYNGSQVEFFIDGVSQGTASASNPSTQTSKPFAVGGSWDGSYHFVGKIDDLHVSNVVRSGAVPTTRGVTADSNTLLIFQSSPYLKAQKGSSATAQAITYTGTVISSPDSIFDNDEYSEAANGGSISFDGTGDYLSLAASDDWGFGNGAWTIEFFVHTTDTDFDPIAAFSATSPFAGWGIRVQSGLVKFFVSDGSSNDGHDTVSGSTTINDGAWHHVALTSADSSNAVSCYVDGTLAGSHTFTVAPSSTGQALRIGADTNSSPARPLTGHISDVRVVKGTAVYTGAFTPPSGPLTTVSNTKLHVKGTDAHVLDKSQVNNLQLIGGAAASTTQAKFGSTASVYFDGSDDYVQTPTSSIFNLGTNQFTVEFFFRTEVDAQGSLVYFLNDSTSVLGILYWHTYNSLALYDSDWITGNDGSGSNYNSITTSTWHYAAITRDTSTLRVFIDGTQVHSGSNTTNYTTNNIKIGRHHSGAYLNGYIQDLRISIGKARYTGSSHTVPTSALKG